MNLSETERYQKPMTDRVEYAEFLYRALAHPLGIVIATNNARSAITALNIARTDARDSELDNLAITRSPHAPDREVFIYKKPKRPERATLENLGLMD